MVAPFHLCYLCYFDLSSGFHAFNFMDVAPLGYANFNVKIVDALVEGCYVENLPYYGVAYDFKIILEPRLFFD